MNIGIREARPTDAAAIVRLIHELAQTSGENSPIAEAYVEKYFASPLGTILLAEKQQEVVGLLSYSLRPDLYHAGNTCLIEELVVREAARGHGVGGALLKDLLSRLEAVGCVEVSVTTMPANTEAIAFYKKHGLTDEAVFLERHLGS